MENVTSMIISLVMAIIAAVPGILAMRQQKRKQDAEVADVITKASAQLIAQYEKRMSEMELNDERHRRDFDDLKIKVEILRDTIVQRDHEISCRDNYIEHLLNGIKRLLAQMMSMNVTPAWQPEDYKEFYTKREE
jgi:hypothetical protein